MKKQIFESDESLIKAKYIGKDGIMGFKRFHEYNIFIIKTNYGYDLESTEDITENKSFQQMIQYASMISIEQNWKKL